MPSLPRESCTHGQSTYTHAKLRRAYSSLTKTNSRLISDGFSDSIENVIGKFLPEQTEKAPDSRSKTRSHTRIRCFCSSLDFGPFSGCFLLMSLRVRVTVQDCVLNTLSTYYSYIWTAFEECEWYRFVVENGRDGNLSSTRPLGIGLGGGVLSIASKDLRKSYFLSHSKDSILEVCAGSS